jgi:phage terminase large subunit-like protein
MTPSELQSWYQTHRKDKTYQHVGMESKKFDTAAKESFDRLTKEQQLKVVKVCAHYGITDPWEIARYRFLAQTNLFALCKLVEKYKDVSDKEYVWIDGTLHSTHAEICNEFFVRKDPTIKTFKKFASQYVGNKQRLLLVPRGGYKSSMDMADCVQWIICFPEVTILVLTGVLRLANDFVGEIKGHFELEETPGSPDLFGKKSLRPRSMDDGSPSCFQILFPEHCIAKDDGKGAEYQTPAVSVIDKEPTVSAASIEQNLTGWHVGVLKLDDVVTNENSQTIDRMKNINKQVSINQAMLHPYGFYDKIGTWYDTQDVYGQDIKNKTKYEAEGEVFPMDIYIRPAWWPTEEAKKLGLIEEEMTAGDYGYWFNDPDNPSSLTYEFLKFKKKTDDYFAIKYLNDPTQMHVVKFPRELLVRRTVNAAALPSTGMIVTCVDTAYTTNSWSDYTVIMTALIYGGRFYIIDMSRGKFNEYELPAMIAAAGLRWKPQSICIEEANAMKYIQREVYREMDKLKIRIPIRLVPLGKGSKANSKKIKAGPVLRFLGDDRLRFINSCPGLEDIYEELSKFGTAASSHDDIVDTLAILINEFAGYADMEGKMSPQSTSFVQDPLAFAKHQVVFADGKYSHHNANVALEFPELGAQQLSQEAAKDAIAASFDPLGDIFI